MTSDMLVGITCDPADYATRLACWPGARHTRIFGGPGKGIPPWLPTRRDSRIATALRLCPGIIPHVSFKDWPDDDEARAMVDAWLDQLPRLGVEPMNAFVRPMAYLTHMHEPGPKSFPPDEYRRRQFQLALWLHDHPNGHFVRQVHIDANIWLEEKGRADPSIYLPGVGWAGCDSYARSYRPQASVDDVLRMGLLISAATGQPPRFPEIGAVRYDNDPTGERRADWIRQLVARAHSEGCALMSWWDDLGTPRKDGVVPDFRLDDEPSRAAWADAMAGRI